MNQLSLFFKRTPAKPHIPHETQLRLGIIYAGYRLALSFLLIALFLVTMTTPLIGGKPFLYLNVLAGYALITLLGYVTLRHWSQRLQNQLGFMLLIDLCALTFILYANGGPNLQIFMLYLVVVLAANILLPPRHALIIALFGAITVIYQQFFYSLAQSSDVRSIGNAILISLNFLGISLFSQLIIRRLNTAELLAEGRSATIIQLQTINQQIIEQNQTGLLVINQNLDILVINKAAQQLIFFQPLSIGELLYQPLSKFNHTLALRIRHAMQLGEHEFSLSPSHANTVSVHITPLESHQEQGYLLLTMQSMQHINQKAQQLKLASLGQLTASIAHEVRNPLAAISQATELLAEAELDPADQELLQVIQKQTKRLDQTIENVLQMSRRKPVQPQMIELSSWIPDMVVDNLGKIKDYIQIQVQPVSVYFDPLQLQHVLINLLQNAVHHSKKVQEPPQVKILGSLDEDGQVILDILDSGLGISAEALTTLFQPFYTTEAKGTGLGLYLSKAFCEANNAHLLYVPQTQGACFRIVFRTDGNS